MKFICAKVISIICQNVALTRPIESAMTPVHHMYVIALLKRVDIRTGIWGGRELNEK